MKQKLVTADVARTLAKYPLYSQEGKGMDSVAIVMFFDPLSKAWWIVTEGEKRGQDWLFYGLVEVLEREWGYFTLSELEDLSERRPIPIERDTGMIPGKQTVREVLADRGYPARSYSVGKAPQSKKAVSKSRSSQSKKSAAKKPARTVSKKPASKGSKGAKR